jgi:hypothetical protein
MRIDIYNAPEKYRDGRSDRGCNDTGAPSKQHSSIHILKRQKKAPIHKNKPKTVNEHLCTQQKIGLRRKGIEI